MTVNVGDKEAIADKGTVKLRVGAGTTEGEFGISEVTLNPAGVKAGTLAVVPEGNTTLAIRLRAGGKTGGVIKAT